MPLEAETHAVHSRMAMPPLAETAFRRSGICMFKDEDPWFDMVKWLPEEPAKLINPYETHKA